jgi:hypothetical protein
LIATTISEAISVSRSAAIAWGVVTESQKAPRPPSVERATTAASGISAIRLR